MTYVSEEDEDEDEDVASEAVADEGDNTGDHAKRARPDSPAYRTAQVLMTNARLAEELPLPLTEMNSGERSNQSFSEGPKVAQTANHLQPILRSRILQMDDPEHPSRKEHFAYWDGEERFMTRYESGGAI
jgi:hypothetical protein